MTMRDLKRIETRRAFFQKFAGGMSTVALAQLMASERLTAGGSSDGLGANPLAPASRIFLRRPRA